MQYFTVTISTTYTTTGTDKQDKYVFKDREKAVNFVKELLSEEERKGFHPEVKENGTQVEAKRDGISIVLRLVEQNLSARCLPSITSRTYDTRIPGLDSPVLIEIMRDRDQGMIYGYAYDRKNPDPKRLVTSFKETSDLTDDLCVALVQQALLEKVPPRA